MHESTHGKILKDDIIKSFFFFFGNHGWWCGCKQEWRFIISILLLKIFLIEENFDF
jgi:hypothetical protein